MKTVIVILSVIFVAYIAYKLIKKIKKTNSPFKGGIKTPVDDTDYDIPDNAHGE